MKYIITKNYAELSDAMKSQMLKHMYSQKPRVNIAITTGKTPVEGYKLLADFVKDKKCFNNVHYYVFDEFYFKGDLKGDCRKSLDYKYFNLAKVNEDNIHDLTYENYKDYDYQLEKVGGLDMVIMGIGTNGHFCGNQPHTFKNWNEGVHLIDRHATETIENLMFDLLHEDYHSNDESLIPANYITMGPKTIMNAKSIIFLLSGKEKAETAKKAFFDPITEDFPVSIFQLHPDVTVILDEDAASLIKEQIRY